MKRDTLSSILKLPYQAGKDGSFLALNEADGSDVIDTVVM